MVEQQQKMIYFLFQQNTELLEWCRLSTSDSKNKFRMTQPKWYCGGAGELVAYLGSLRSNFRTHNHLFHDDTGKIQYAKDHIRLWVYYSNRDMQKTTMLDPITWGQNLQKDNSTCLHDFDGFVGEMKKISCDKDRTLHMVTNSFYDLLQGFNNPNKNARAYANWLLRNWRGAEWDEVEF